MIQTRMLFFLAATLLSAAPTLLSQAESKQPPVVTYGTSRESKEWIEIGGTSVAIDHGAEWRDVMVYLSMTFDLVAVDPKTKKAIWHADVGAFWNGFTFKEVEAAPGTKTWAVELLPIAAGGPGKEKRRYHDLKTGKRLLEEKDVPEGKEITPLTAFGGPKAADAAPLKRLIDDAETFQKEILDRRLKGIQGAPTADAVDFKKFRALVVFYGEVVNMNGVQAKAWESEKSITVRLIERRFQTFGPDGGAQRHTPWGIFLLPRTDPPKAVEVFRNTQNLIGGPPLWTAVAIENVGPPIK